MRGDLHKLFHRLCGRRIILVIAYMKGSCLIESFRRALKASRSLDNRLLSLNRPRWFF